MVCSLSVPSLSSLSSLSSSPILPPSSTHHNIINIRQKLNAEILNHNLQLLRKRQSLDDSPPYLFLVESQALPHVHRQREVSTDLKSERAEKQKIDEEEECEDWSEEYITSDTDSELSSSGTDDAGEDYYGNMGEDYHADRAAARSQKEMWKEIKSPPTSRIKTEYRKPVIRHPIGSSREKLIPPMGTLCAYFIGVGLKMKIIRLDRKCLVLV